MHDNSGHKHIESSAVLARRAIHLAVLVFMSRWHWLLHTFGFFIGLFFVLCPVVFPSAAVFQCALAKILSEDFSSFGIMSITCLAINMWIGVYRNINTKHFPGGYDPTQQRVFPTYAEMLKTRMLPKTEREEKSFWAEIGAGAVDFMLWIVGFGVISFFYKLGF